MTFSVGFLDRQPLPFGGPLWQPLFRSRPSRRRQEELPRDRLGPLRSLMDADRVRQERGDDLHNSIHGRILLGNSPAGNTGKDRLGTYVNLHKSPTCVLL